MRNGQTILYGTVSALSESEATEVNFVRPEREMVLHCYGNATNDDKRELYSSCCDCVVFLIYSFTAVRP